ncbi:MAG: 30S ribosomal protein S6 [Candidatus Omnitrophica bacterium]|nr:30S ribosomal protein S6 [Candidatus Omnitrophota bacterium]
MSRNYEALVILRSQGTDEEVAQQVGRVEEAVKRLGGTIDSSKSFGRRRLAYRIGRQTEGYYHLVEFQVAPEQLAELKRQFRLNEALLRFLVLTTTPRSEVASVAAG